MFPLQWKLGERECCLDWCLHSKEMFPRSLKKTFLGYKAEQEVFMALKSIVVLSGTFLAVQWLGFWASTAGRTGSILVREARSWLQIMVQWVRVCSVAQSYPILCDPLDCSPPDSFILGILQANILEWVPISSFMLQTKHEKTKWNYMHSFEGRHRNNLYVSKQMI